jgi:hypothetical protein
VAKIRFSTIISHTRTRILAAKIDSKALGAKTPHNSFPKTFKLSYRKDHATVGKSNNPVEKKTRKDLGQANFGGIELGIHDTQQ